MNQRINANSGGYFYKHILDHKNINLDYKGIKRLIAADSWVFPYSTRLPYPSQNFDNPSVFQITDYVRISPIKRVLSTITITPAPFLESKPIICFKQNSANCSDK